MRMVRYCAAALAAGLCVAVSGCGAAGSGPYPAGSAAPSSGAVVLPCDPQAASCWIPGAGETFMAYKPPRHYATAADLARAAGCIVLSGPQTGGAPPAPAATRTMVECSLNGATMGSYLTDAMLFPSPLAEATWAGGMTRGAERNDNAFYGVLGPGWAIGGMYQVDDTRALQALQGTGGVVVCFPDSTGAGGDCTP